MVKKIILGLFVFIIIISISGCGKLDDLPSNPIIYHKEDFQNPIEDDDYVAYVYNDKKYIPYGYIKSKGLFRDLSYAFGRCLGYVYDDKNERVYELLNEDSDVWIVSYYVNGMMDQPIVLREINSKNINIPESIDSFGYEYWK